MIATNISELRTNLSTYLDMIEKENETLIIKKETGKGTVMISLEEYNSMIETLHLLSSRKNSNRLFESIEQMKKGEKITTELIDD